MTKDVTEAGRIIEERRERAIREHDERTEALMKNEKFADMKRERSFLSFEISRKRVFGEDFSADESRLKEVNSELKKILKKEKGYSLDEPDYFCKKCKDTGFVGGKRCECFEEARIAVNERDYPNLKPLPKNLRDVDFGVYGDKAEEFNKYGRYLNHSLKSGANYIVLFGAPGVGKTYLAEVFLNQALYSGNSIMEINGVKLNRVFLDYHCATLEGKREIWENLIYPDVMLIDDLGVEGILKNVTLQYLYELVTERSEKITLITTNLDDKAFMARYDQRITSRLRDKRKGVWIAINGKDIR